MRIILIGAKGTVGSAISDLLKDDEFNIVEVGLKTGDFQVDITSVESIKSLFDKVGLFDGLICVAGSGYYGPLDQMSTDEAMVGIKNKLLGQVNLVQIGKKFINENGFFTLTSGYLAEEGNINSANLGMINAALNGFVVNAALEMPRGIRLNVVSPSVLTESVAKYGEPKHRFGIAAVEVAETYRRTIMETINGQVLKAYGKLK